MVAEAARGNIIAEFYSSPRVTEWARRYGLRPGWSLDLKEVDPWDGKPWDFSKAEKRERARRLVKEHEP